MRLYLLLPLAVAIVCLVYVWYSNRRAACRSALWPKGMTLAGPVDRPDVAFDGELFLACTAKFGTIRCQVLRIGKDADVEARAIHAATVLVDGRLRGVASLGAERLLRVRGEVLADDVRSPRIQLLAGSRATVLTVSKDARLERDPRAQAKGFFADLQEARGVDYVRRLESLEGASPLPS